MTQQQWPMFVWAAVVAGAWTAINRTQVRPTLPIEHVAGAPIPARFTIDSVTNSFRPATQTHRWRRVHSSRS